MKTRIFALAVALAMLGSELFLGVIPAQAATFFPAVQVGDVFTGSIMLDPTIPARTVGDPLLQTYVSPAIGPMFRQLLGQSQ